MWRAGAQGEGADEEDTGVPTRLELCEAYAVDGGPTPLPAARRWWDVRWALLSTGL